MSRRNQGCNFDFWPWVPQTVVMPMLNSWLFMTVEMQYMSQWTNVWFRQGWTYTFFNV